MAEGPGVEEGLPVRVQLSRPREAVAFGEIGRRGVIDAEPREGLGPIDARVAPRGGHGLAGGESRIDP